MKAFQPRARAVVTPHAHNPDSDPSLPLVMTRVGRGVPDVSGRNRYPGIGTGWYGTAMRWARPSVESIKASQHWICKSKVGADSVWSRWRSATALVWE